MEDDVWVLLASYRQHFPAEVQSLDTVLLFQIRDVIASSTLNIQKMVARRFLVFLD